MLRPGKQIELVSAEMLGLGRDGQPRPVARASGWRLQTLDTAALVHAPAPALRPLSAAVSRDMAKDFSGVVTISLRMLTTDAGVTVGSIQLPSTGVRL